MMMDDMMIRHRDPKGDGTYMHEKVNAHATS